MNVLYLLETAPGASETFILRELREVVRQGVRIMVAHPAPGGYRAETGETIFNRPGAEAGGPIRGRILRPAPAPAALLRGLSLSPRGLARARAHAAGEGRGLGSGIRQAVPIAAAARRFRADLIHAHFAARACADAMLASWISAVPFTFTAHGYDVHLQPPPDYAARAAAAAAVVTVSESNARVLRERHGVPASKIRVIPCGVDTGLFAPAGEPEPGRIVSVIRLHRDKGADVLIDAAERLLQKGVDFHLEILGDGEERPAIEARLRGPLGARVRLAGRAGEPEVIEALRRASLFVLPSRTEGMPVSLMEAMACGRPAVAADVGGVAELLDGGRCGVLVPREDPASLAAAIASLLADAALRRSLGSAARDRIVRRFRLEETVGALVALWADSCRDRPGGSRRGR